MATVENALTAFYWVVIFPPPVARRSSLAQQDPHRRTVNNRAFAPNNAVASGTAAAKGQALAPDNGAPRLKTSIGDRAFAPSNAVAGGTAAAKGQALAPDNGAPRLKTSTGDRAFAPDNAVASGTAAAKGQALAPDNGAPRLKISTGDRGGAAPSQRGEKELQFHAGKTGKAPSDDAPRNPNLKRVFLANRGGDKPAHTAAHLASHKPAPQGPTTAAARAVPRGSGPPQKSQAGKKETAAEPKPHQGPGHGLMPNPGRGSGPQPKRVESAPVPTLVLDDDESDYILVEMALPQTAVKRTTFDATRDGSGTAGADDTGGAGHQLSKQALAPALPPRVPLSAAQRAACVPNDAPSENGSKPKQATSPDCATRDGSGTAGTNNTGGAERHAVEVALPPSAAQRTAFVPDYAPSGNAGSNPNQAMSPDYATSEGSGKAGTRPAPFNRTPMGVNSISPAHLHVRPMWALSTCR